MREDRVIIANNEWWDLALKLSEVLGWRPVKANISYFPDREISLCLDWPSEIENQYGALLIHSISQPVNERLVELFFMLDTAKNRGVNNFLLLIPYLGYARQDRPISPGDSVGARAIANLLQGSGIKKIAVLDIHSPKIEEFFGDKLENIDPTKFFTQALVSSAEVEIADKDLLVVAPDQGSKERAGRLSRELRSDMVVISKERGEKSQCKAIAISNEGIVKGKKCRLVDDIVDSGATLCAATDLLLELGAASVKAIITHPILSGRGLETIERSRIEQIIVTNSPGMIKGSLPKKFTVLDINPLLYEEAIKLSYYL